jgi:alpha-galactosidase
MKVCCIGAGSIGFTRRLVSDILTIPELREIEIALMDIDADNLELVYNVIRQDIAANGLSTVKLTRTTNRRDAVRDAQYIILMARIGGLEAFALDVEIPMRYGVNQCVGDTLCAGGIMYGQRTIPVTLDICADIRELAAPGAMLLNYMNPNAMNTWAANAWGGVRTLGLCHGVRHGIIQIAEVLNIPEKELDIICAGLNHQTWYIQVRHRGVDMRGKLLDGFKKHPRFSREEKVRIDILERFGYYSTESNGHLSEYLAWYRKRPGDLENWIDRSMWIHGEPGGYLRHCREERADFERKAREPQTVQPFSFTPENRSIEHASYIIEGLETGRVYRGYFNVINEGAITNLPPDCVVEVPGYVDGSGVSIPIVGDLPLGAAAICAQSVSVQRLAVEAAVHGDPQLLKQAMLLDPLTGAVCSPPEVWALADEMLKAEAQWLPQYHDYIRGLS